MLGVLDGNANALTKDDYTILSDFIKELNGMKMSDEEIIAKTKADVADSNKGQPAYRKVQNVYVSFNEFEKNSTRKVIRQKVIDTYTKKPEQYKRRKEQCLKH